MLHHLRTLSALALTFTVGLALQPGVGAATIVVGPQPSMVDQKVRMTVKGSPGSPVAVTLVTQRFGRTFQAGTSVTVAPNGSADIPMQLFWSVMPTDAPAQPFEGHRDTFLAPRAYTLTATDKTGTAKRTIQRIVLAPGTKRTVVDDGTFVATLFSAKTGHCRPGILVLGGSDGGVPEEQAAIVASHGFATLALAYFGAPGLEKTLVNIPIERVSQAIAFLHESAAVCPKNNIGILGASKGAELALIAASRSASVGAVAAIAPSSVAFGGIGKTASGVESSSWTFGAAPLPYANGDVPQTVMDQIAKQRSAGTPVSYKDEYLAQLDDSRDPAAVIRVERIGGPLLLIAGGSDQVWPSQQMANQIIDRRKAAKTPYHDVLLVYPDAGHSIGIPYEFAKAELAHSAVDVGGTSEANESASEAAWPQIIAFFKANLAARPASALRLPERPVAHNQI